ncbi:DUF2304 domain-containing protein [Microbacterium sp. VKM Ac-2870]|uniref:DUF2304 domain-containing protein n=1 Tax=Microbacterium sp. VKM Ac-2870 TaxID=2783825 RepID=UPI00188A56E1|nr:DUF2304 domain-containing protein [Microbacterium sp. VKM Ac-2870]MBF4561689.1 DUF2304 domain-containing protein [Microbacterium sp. VKM Ac-2870]
MIVWLGLGFALIILAVIFWLLLTRKLREKYALLWLLIGVAMLVLTVFPGVLNGLADLVGVELPANLLFILALALLIGVTLHQSFELSTAEDEIRRVAEEVAILRAETERLDTLLTAASVSTAASSDPVLPGRADAASLDLRSPAPGHLDVRDADGSTA